MLRRFVTVTIPTALVAILAIVAGVEAWTRTHWDAHRGRPGLFLSDPVRVERFAPGYDGWFAGVPVHINALGFRDPRDYELRKGPRTVRILILGDSVTFGHGSIYEHTYPFLAEQRLRRWRGDVDWQVWNLAVPGYNTAQELAQLVEVGPRFTPDQVVVGFYMNDVSGNEIVRAASWRARISSSIRNAIRARLYSYELYRRNFLRLRYRVAPQQIDAVTASLAGDEQLLAVPARVSRLPEQDLTDPAPISEEDRQQGCPGKPVESFSAANFDSEPGMAAWRQAVDGFHDLARTHQQRIAFLINLAPRVCQTRDMFDPRSTNDLNAHILRILSDGTPAASTHDAFTRYRPSEMPQAGGHSLGNANAVKADVLFDFLRDRLLPPVMTARGL